MTEYVQITKYLAEQLLEVAQKLENEAFYQLHEAPVGHVGEGQDLWQSDYDQAVQVQQELMKQIVLGETSVVLTRVSIGDFEEHYRLPEGNQPNLEQLRQEMLKSGSFWDAYWDAFDYAVEVVHPEAEKIGDGWENEDDD